MVACRGRRSRRGKLVAERTGKPGLAGAGWADNDQVVGITDPLTGGEGLEKRTVKAASNA